LYKNKYLKYKAKYLNLSGGVPIKTGKSPEQVIKRLELDKLKRKLEKSKKKKADNQNNPNENLVILDAKIEIAEAELKITEKKYEIVKEKLEISTLIGKLESALDTIIDQRKIELSLVNQLTTSIPQNIIKIMDIIDINTLILSDLYTKLDQTRNNIAVISLNIANNNKQIYNLVDNDKELIKKEKEKEKETNKNKIKDLLIEKEKILDEINRLKNIINERIDPKSYKYIPTLKQLHDELILYIYDDKYSERIDYRYSFRYHLNMFIEDLDIKIKFNKILIDRIFYILIYFILHNNIDCDDIHQSITNMIKEKLDNFDRLDRIDLIKKLCDNLINYESYEDLKEKLNINSNINSNIIFPNFITFDLFKNKTKERIKTNVLKTNTTNLQGLIPQITKLISNIKL